MGHIRDKRGAPYLSCGFPLKTQQDLEDREKEALRAPLDECFFGMKRMCSAEFSIFIVVLHWPLAAPTATEIDSKLRQHSRCTNNQHWLHIYMCVCPSMELSDRREEHLARTGLMHHGTNGTPCSKLICPGFQTRFRAHVKMHQHNTASTTATSKERTDGVHCTTLHRSHAPANTKQNDPSKSSSGL